SRDGSGELWSRSIACSIVWRPTTRAERISVRTERWALRHAITPPRTRLRRRTTQTRPIRRNRSDIARQRLSEASPRTNQVVWFAQFTVTPELVPGVHMDDGAGHNEAGGAAHKARLILTKFGSRSK